MRSPRAITATLFGLLLVLPPSSTASDATIDGIPRHRPRAGRARPVVAILGDNAATETTDYVVPYGILAEANIAEVVALSTEPGPIQMRPALRFLVHETSHQFAVRVPDGADYVIVPNIYEGAEKDTVLDWVRGQSKRGATIVGVCDGVPVLANAGLLEGRRSTAHWRTIDSLERAHPNTTWIRNGRYIADGNIITTSGVSASIPISLALIDAIAGRERAEAVARRLGVDAWSPLHDSEQFYLGSKLFTGLRNKLSVWDHEKLGIEVTRGVDEISLALTADIYSRTRKSWAYAVAKTWQPVATRRGLKVLPDRIARGSFAAMLPLSDSRPAKALETSLEGVRARYGEPTAAFVAVQIEYPWRREH